MIRTLVRFGALAYVVMCSVAVLQVPGALPAGVGLDPSWTVALSRASAGGLVFGRDVVFTYGPLGYLVTRIADVGNFRSMVEVQLMLATLVFAAVIAYAAVVPSIVARVVVILTAPWIIGVTPVELWPVLCVVLVFAYSVERTHPAALLFAGAGVVAGLASLTKFTTAIDIALPSCCFLSIELVRGRTDRKRREAVALAAGCFAYATIAASAFTFLAVDRGAVFACGVETAGVLLLAAPAARRRSPMVLAALLLAVLIVGASPSYRSYIGTSIAIAGEYSSGLALEGPGWQVWSAVTWIAALVALCVSVRSGRTFALTAALVVFSWCTFKSGFVRQDLHVLTFYSGALFAGLIVFAGASSRRSSLAAAGVFGCAIVAFGNEFSAGGASSSIALVSLSGLASNASTLADLGASARAVDAADLRNDRADRISELARHVIGARPTAVVPVESDEAFASGLRWMPEPVFDAILASSPELDELDRKSLEGRTNDAILYGYDSIDGRLPLSSEPATFAFTLCHYVPAMLDSSPHAPLVLLRAAGSRCIPGERRPAQRVSWNTPLSLPDARGRLVFAQIDVRPNLAGRALTLAFRAPLVHISLHYADGSSTTYRLVTDDASDGVLVGPMPRDPPELAALFAGRLRNDVRSVSVDGDVRWFETPQIAFETYRLSKGRRVDQSAPAMQAR